MGFESLANTLNGRPFGSRSGFTKTIGSQFATSPARLSGVFCAIIPAWTYNTSTEIVTAQGLTAVAVDGDLVGQGIDSSPGCFSYGAATGTRPAFRTGRLMRGTYDFAGAELFTIPNSKAAFKSFHTQAIGGIAIWIEPKNLAATRTIACSNRDTGAQAGIELDLNSTGKIGFFVTNGSNGNFGVTTDDALVVGTGQWVFISLAGSGASNGRIKIGTGTDKTFNCTYSTGGFPSGESVDQLTIGRHSSTSTKFLQAYLGPIIFFNRAITAADEAAILNFNPIVTDANPIPWGIGDLDDTYALNRYDFTADANLYTDDAATTHPATQGDPIRVAKHLWSVDTDIGRNLTRGSATAPIRWSPTGTSAHCARWGFNQITTDQLALVNTPPTCRRWSTAFIVRQLREGGGANGQGSQVINRAGSSVNYMTVLATDSTEDPGNPGLRTVAHDSAGTAISSIPVAGTDGATLGEEYFNCIVLTRNGSSVTLYINGEAKATLTTNEIFGWDSIGQSSVSTWNFWGYYLELAWLPFTFSAVQAGQFEQAAINNHTLLRPGDTYPPLGGTVAVEDADTILVLDPDTAINLGT